MLTGIIINLTFITLAYLNGLTKKTTLSDVTTNNDNNFSSFSSFIPVENVEEEVEAVVTLLPTTIESTALTNSDLVFIIFSICYVIVVQLMIFKAFSDLKCYHFISQRVNKEWIAVILPEFVVEQVFKILKKSYISGTSHIHLQYEVVVGIVHAAGFLPFAFVSLIRYIFS